MFRVRVFCVMFLSVLTCFRRWWQRPRSVSTAMAMVMVFWWKVRKILEEDVFQHVHMEKGNGTGTPYEFATCMTRKVYICVGLWMFIYWETDFGIFKSQLERGFRVLKFCQQHALRFLYMLSLYLRFPLLFLYDYEWCSRSTRRYFHDCFFLLSILSCCCFQTIGY